MRGPSAIGGGCVRLGFLQILRSCLAPYLNAAGFELVDAADEDTGVGQLEYRTTGSARPLVLGLYHLPHERLITAELWAPDTLTRPLDDLTVERVALRYRSWQYDGTYLPSSLVEAISTEIHAWLAAFLDQSDPA